MRRILIAILVLLGLLAWPCLSLAADEQPLSDVKFDNPDQQAVAAVIVQLQNDYNAFKSNQLMSLFADDAQILTGMKGNRNGAWVAKKEYADIVEGKMRQLAFMHVSIQYYKPSLVEVKNQVATVKLPYILTYPNHDAWEKGFFRFDLVKINDKWLIKKMYWEVTDSRRSMDYTLSDRDAVVF